jgi:hypothetical protein
MAGLRGVHWPILHDFEDDRISRYTATKLACSALCPRRALILRRTTFNQSKSFVGTFSVKARRRVVVKKTWLKW